PYSANEMPSNIVVFPAPVAPEMTNKRFSSSALKSITSVSLYGPNAVIFNTIGLICHPPHSSLDGIRLGITKAFLHQDVPLLTPCKMLQIIARPLTDLFYDLLERLIVRFQVALFASHALHWDKSHGFFPLDEEQLSHLIIERKYNRRSSHVF